jgi:hypothetical protein
MAPPFLQQVQPQFPANADFSKQLALLGDTIGQGIQANRRQSLLSDVLGPDGKLDYDKAVVGLLSIGDNAGAAALANYRNAQVNANSVYGTPIYGTNPDGSTAIGTFDKSGTFRPVNTGGFTPTPGAKLLDTGTGYVPVNSRTGQPMQGGTYNPTTPNQPAAPGMPAAPPPQTGFIPKDVAGVEREKGVGEEQAKLIAGKGKAEATLRSLESQWKLMDDELTSIIEKTDWTKVGPIGSFTSRFPGTPAFDLARKLDTIKANIGFDKLQSMRDESPTGGALGNVSDAENRLTQAVRGSPDQGQSPTQFKSTITRIRDDLRALAQEKRRAVNQTYGKIPAVPTPVLSGQGGQPQQPQQMPRLEVGKTQINGYTYRGGNPNDPRSWGR